MTTIRKHLASIDTDPVLSDILTDGINSVFTGCPISDSSYPLPYRLLCRQQALIGWDNLLRGFASTEWSALEASYQQAHDLKIAPAIVFTIHHVWPVLHELWVFRCSQRHARDLERHTNEVRRQVIASITDLYNQRHLVLPTDRSVFPSDLTQHLQSSTSDLQAWLLNHQSYLRHSISESTRQNLTNTSSLTSYFPP